MNKFKLILTDFWLLLSPKFVPTTWDLITEKLIEEYPFFKNHLWEKINDWYIDEIYPWYNTIYWEWSINDFLDYAKQEYYNFWKWEREYYKKEMEKAKNENKEIIIKFPSWLRYYLNKPDYINIYSYLEKIWKTKNELDYIINDAKKSWLEYIDIDFIENFWVKDFNRDEIIKSLNWKKFWLEKRKEIQDNF